jgi:hypothetical protein
MDHEIEFRDDYFWNEDIKITIHWILQISMIYNTDDMTLINFCIKIFLWFNEHLNDNEKFQSSF